MKYYYIILLFVYSSTLNGQGSYAFKRSNNSSFTYYVDTGYLASDNNPGKSPRSPFKTITKALSVAVSGDRIGLNRGCAFYDTINISSKNNIVIDAYGFGAKPIVTSLIPITSWTNTSGNIWRSSNVKFPLEVTTVYFGSTKGTLARTPKASFYTMTGGSNLTVVDATNAQADNYWAGCEIMIQDPLNWWVKTVRTTTYLSHIFTYTINDAGGDSAWNGTHYCFNCTHPNYLDFGGATGKLYFIQNHINCITTTNEWAYDATNKYLYIYSTVLPTNILASFFTNLLNIDNSSNITIRNINFYGSADNTVQILNSNKINFNNCNINLAGRHGIYISKTTNSTIFQDTIIDSNNRGIFLHFSGFITLFRNSINKTGYTLGSARYDIGPNRFEGMVGQGIYMLSNYCNEIAYNNIYNTCYAGVEWYGSNSINVHHNLTYNYGMRMDDVGGIRTFYSQAEYNVKYQKCPYPFLTYQPTRINNNIVDRDLKPASSVVYHYSIYVDEGCSYIGMENNFLNSGQSGGQVAGGSNTFRNNTINLVGQGIGSDDGIKFYDVGAISESRVTNYSGKDTITGNVVVAQYPNSGSTFLTAINAGTSALDHYVNNNKYYYPFGNLSSKGDTMAIRGTKKFKIAGWIADDANYNWQRSNEQIITPSLFINSIKPRLNYTYTITNPTMNNKLINISDLPYSDYINLDGTTPSYPIILSPYQGIILVRTQ